MIFISRLYNYWLAIITVYLALFLSSCLQEHAKTGELQLEDGLEVYEIASEPLIYDPVAFVCDELGAMYVVEHRGYPDPAEGGKPATREGSIALIQDTNYDGIYDKRCDFVTGLTYPNGVLAWKGGIFVTCAPDIFYFKDTTGDGIADIRETVLTGFFDTKTAQIRMSHPTMGLDGLIYITGGLNGGSVTSPRYPERPAVSYKSSDGRFDPESLVFETVSGRSQFGLSFDAFGRRFGCSNRHPVMQAVLEPEYLNRNPHLLYSETIQNVSRVQAEAVVYPISGAAITADFIPSLIGRSHQGTFTSASGIFVLSDESLGSDHLGNFFICESAQSMVQRQVVSPDGPTFQSQIAQDGVEFLASKHEWFRPVFLGIGSSPGLYVVDMHRKVIDHPSYVPESMRDQLDFQSGRDMGRIYRIVKKGIKSKPIPAFDDNQEIVELLNSSSDWMRVTAFRLLLERTPETVAPALHEIAVGGNLPQSRVRAIWMLHHLGELDLETLAKVVRDPISGVREQALSHLAQKAESDSEALQLLIEFADDPDVRIRFLAALELGNFEGEIVTDALARIAAKDGENQWTRVAVLSGVKNRFYSFAEAFQRQPDIAPTCQSAVMQDLGRLFGTGATMSACSQLMQKILNGSDDMHWKIATAAGLAEGVFNRENYTLMATENIFQRIMGTPATKSQDDELKQFMNRIIAVAEDRSANVMERQAAVSVLGYLPPKFGFPLLEKLIHNPVESELHADAIYALTKQGLSQGCQILTSKSSWTSFTPSIRTLTLSLLISKPNYVNQLYQAIENGIIQTTEISSSDRQRLLNSQDKNISGRAKELFSELESGGRMQVYEMFKSLDKTGDAKMGKEVFIRTCSVCHSYAGTGGNVGPDLTGVKNQPADALLLHTLVPNYEVYPNYLAVLIETNAGDSFSGWIETESENSVTLRTSSGTQQSILRSNIKSLINTGKSLMPDGLEQTMTQVEMIDLISFLKSGG